MKMNGAGRKDKARKHTVRIVLLVILLLLVFSGPGTLPAQAQPLSGKTLSNGIYYGAFHFEATSINVTRLAKGPVTENGDQFFNFIVEGVIEIWVLEKDQARLFIDHNYRMLYAIHSHRITAGQGSCSVLGAQYSDLFLDFMRRGHMLAFDPKKPSFPIDFVLGGIQEQAYTSTSSGNEKCKNSVSQEVLKLWLEGITNHFMEIGTLHFNVTDASKQVIYGSITCPEWEIKVDTQYGWYDQKVTGKWSAFNINNKKMGVP